MGRVPGPRCARGQNCYHVRKLGSEIPPKVRHEGAHCRKCQEEEDRKIPSTDAGDEERFSNLLHAARVILESGITDEDKIVPTLVFAANSDKVPSLKSARESVVADGDDSVISEESYAWFWAAFDKFAVLSEVRRGVPILRELPAAITVLKDDRGYIKEIAIDVFKRSVDQDDIAKPYAEHLKKEGVSYDPDRGEIAYKFHNDSQESFLRLLVRPETRSMDSADARILPTKAGQPRFPEPLVVAGVFDILRGSRIEGRFPGYRERLVGRERGPKRLNTERLALACVAWYVGERGAVATRRELKHRVARILNRKLLAPCGRVQLSEDGVNPAETLWKKGYLKDVESVILRLERAIQRNAEVRVGPSPE
jgi:hypothetical protein